MRSGSQQNATALPSWAQELIVLYESHAYSQFLLSGNVLDRILLPLGSKASIRTLNDFLLDVLLPSFDVVLSYDLGNGIQVLKGEATFKRWPRVDDDTRLPKTPRAAAETLTQYFRFCANLKKLNQQTLQVGCIVNSAHLVAPALQGGWSYDLSALAMILRDWSCDNALEDLPLATFLVTPNENDLHPLLVNNPRAARVAIPLPTSTELESAFSIFSESYPTALSGYREALERPALQLAGATLSSIEGLLKTKEYCKEPLRDSDLVALKKELVERDCNGLIEFIEPEKSLDDYHGQAAVKDWLRKDLALWEKNDLEAMPMGYLLCGPVGTGKTFLVECLAGEASVPVVKLKNFRDKWVGSTESNLEQIFRLLHALGRCVVFIDEADQTLGQRTVASGDSGVSGRVYSMIADEMSDTRNRGKIIWVLASSRPDLIEVDLKRPGRVDVKIPLFPTVDAKEGFQLIQALCKSRGVVIEEDAFSKLKALIPTFLTPGAAEALAVKVYRTQRTEEVSAIDALASCLRDYQNPVSREVLEFQTDLAIQESTDLEFIPAHFRAK